MHEVGLGRRAPGAARGDRHSRVQALSVVKFASGVRPGSYRSRRSDEQARWSRRLERRSFVAHELLLGALLKPFARRSPYLRFDEATHATPGGVVAELRRIRGLD